MNPCLLVLAIHTAPVLGFQVVAYGPPSRCPKVHVEIREPPRQVTVAWGTRRFVCDLGSYGEETPELFYYRLGYTRAYQGADQPISCFAEQRT